jgi:hypothetical protein
MSRAVMRLSAKTSNFDYSAHIGLHKKSDQNSNPSPPQASRAMFNASPNSSARTQSTSSGPCLNTVCFDLNQSDFGVLSLEHAESICSVPEFQDSIIPQMPADRRIFEQSKCSTSTAWNSPVCEPTRHLRPRISTAVPQPPPKRFARTSWRGLVRKAMIASLKTSC